MKTNNKKRYFPLSHLFFRELFETNINTNLNMMNNRIENVLVSSKNFDAVTLGQIEDFLQQSSSENYLSITGNSIEKPITGDLIFNEKSTITQISSPINNTDAVNFQTISEITDKFLTTKGNLLSTPFSGNISFDNLHLIKGLSNPKEPHDAVNFQTLISFFNNYFLIKGDSLLNTLNINNQTLTNLKNPKIPSDGINLQTVMKIINNTQTNFIPLVGTTQNNPITGNILLQKKKISGLSIAKNNSDCVNLNLLNTTLNKYLLKSGGILQKQLNSNNNFITNLGFPKNNLDLINKEYLTNSLNTFIKLLGGTTYGNINLNNYNVINLKNPESINDGLNLSTLETHNSLHLNNFYIPISGNLPNSFISGNLIFNKTSTITNLSNPIQNADIVNLQSLKKTANEYCSLKGDSLTGNINLNKNFISNISNPKTENEALNLQTLENLLKEKKSIYIPFTGNTNDNPISGNLLLSNTNLSQISLANNNLDIINLNNLILSFSNKLLLSGGTLSGTLNINNKKIINIANPSSTNNNAINLLTMKNYLENYMQLTGGSINYELNNNNIIKNLRNPSEDQDAINLQTLNQTISIHQETFIPLSGTSISNPITGNLFFNNTNTATGLATPIENFDSINLLFLKSTSNNYLLLKGGSLTGSLNMQNFSIKNVLDITNEKEFSLIINYRTLKKFFSNYLPLLGGIVTGSINCNNHVISNIPIPKDSKNIVNKNYLTNYLNSQKSLLIPMSGNTKEKEISGNLLFNNALVSGLANPTNPTDAVNLQTLNTKFSSYMPLSGGTLSGSLSLNNQKITNLSNPTNSTDAVPLKYAQNYISSQESGNYLKLSGTTSDSPFTGSLTFSNSLVSGLANPTNSTDAVNLQTLNTKFSPYMPLSGGTLSGSLILSNQTITNIPNPVNMTDAVPYKYTLEKYMEATNNYLKLTGSTESSIITGNLTFSNSLVSGLANPTNSTDAVNLQTLNNKFSPYMPLSGGTLSGSLSLNNQKITNLSNPTNPTNAVNLQTLNNKFSPYMPLSGGTMIGSINANNQTINNLTPNITQDKTRALTLADIHKFFYGEFYSLQGAQYNEESSWSINTPISFSWSNGINLGSPNSGSFFNIGSIGSYQDSALNILLPGLYTFTFSILTNDMTQFSSITTILQCSPSIQKILNIGILKSLSSFSYTISVYIDPSFSNPYITMMNSGPATIQVYSINYSINKIMD